MKEVSLTVWKPGQVTDGIDFEPPGGWKNEQEPKDAYELMASLMPILGFRIESTRSGDDGFQRRDYINGEGITATLTIS